MWKVAVKVFEHVTTSAENESPSKRNKSKTQYPSKNDNKTIYSANGFFELSVYHRILLVTQAE